MNLSNVNKNAKKKSRKISHTQMHSTRQDGGWGWAVVAGAFVAQLLSDGISYGFGILYVDLMETYHGTSAEISSIGSLSYGAFSFIGKVFPTYFVLAVFFFKFLSNS